jgi:hypothetical protein
MGNNPSIQVFLIVAIVVIGLAMSFMVVPQQASATCQVQHHGKGATITKCQVPLNGGSFRSFDVTTPSGHINQSAHFVPK